MCRVDAQVMEGRHQLGLAAEAVPGAEGDRDGRDQQQDEVFHFHPLIYRA